MLDVLLKIEEELPDLLKNSGWQGMDITFSEPRIERVWKKHDDHILMLHCIHPCKTDEAMVHNHEWPFAVRIISGAYKMLFGFSASDTSPSALSTLNFGPGAEYAITHKNEWHAVIPNDRPTYSLTVRGKRWGESEIEGYNDHGFKSLTNERIEEILEIARSYYSS